MSNRPLWARALSTLRGYRYMLSRLTKHEIGKIRLRFGGYERKFRRKTGRFPNYDNPTGYGDKIAWMRLYDRNPLYPTLVDKIAVRDYVRERVGDGILVPRYGVWKRARDIDFSALPNSFVLKCNHESGFVILCKDKNILDHDYARIQLDTRLMMNHSDRCLEWPYGKVPRRIVAEQLLVNADGSAPTNYDIHCFGGRPGYVVVRTGEARAYHSPDWEHLHFSATATPSVPVERPEQLERMLEIATALSEGLRYCRIDLYAIEDKVFFGEITLFSGAGTFKLNPECYDFQWAQRIELPLAREVAKK